MGKFKAGTKIRLIREPIYGYRDIGEVFIAADDYYGTRDAQSVDGTYLQAFIGRDGKVAHCPSEYFEEVAPELKLEVGKFYKAANGTKVGPMYIRSDGRWSGRGLHTIGSDGLPTGCHQVYNGDGSVHILRDGEEQHVLISEWSDEVTFKVGDKVRRVREDHAGMKANDVGTVVAISGSSMRLKEFGADNGYSHDPKYFELVPSGPVTTQTITRNSVVPGVYGRLEVKAVNQEQGFVTVCLNNQSLKGGDGQYLNADELDALADTARLIANAMRNPEVVE